MRTSGRLTPLLIAASLALSATARAQPDDTSPPPTSADLDRAKAIYDQGAQAYRAGSYQHAIELFLAAYALSRAPAILFNVAQAYRLAGTEFCPQALDYYRRSLAEEPGAANRGEIEDRITEMERCVQDSVASRPPSPARSPPKPQHPHPTRLAAAPASPPPAAPARHESARVTAAPPSSDRPRHRILPLVTAGAGALALVTGGVLYWRARVEFDSVQSSCPCAPGSFSGWETATNASYVLMTAGTAALGAGLLWWWTSSRHAGRLSASVTPTGGGAAWAVDF